ncbi:MAG TPA: VCBS repeat-containing protein [Terracidiphilus sp.]
MIRHKSLSHSGIVASFALTFLFTFASLVSGLYAQSTAGVMNGAVLSPSAPPAFVVAPSIPLGYTPTGVATGHLTSSGRLDVVTADYTSGNITVFVGMGHGSFAPGVTYATGPHPGDVKIVDIDGDGNADVVVTSESEATISVFPGNGDGTLAARKIIAIGFSPAFLAMGDFS